MGRAELRLARRALRKKGDLNRASTHQLRTHDGMKAKKRATQSPSIAEAIAKKLEG